MFTSVLHKTSYQNISRRSRAVTVKKCIKKCNARAELFCNYVCCRFFNVLVVFAVAKAPSFVA